MLKQVIQIQFKWRLYANYILLSDDKNINIDILSFAIAYDHTN